MNAFVVPDAHGDLASVANLLQRAGIIDAGLERVDRDTLVVQIGDLCNCVESSTDADLACLKQAPEWFDVMLVGNHEHPHFGGPAFGGYWANREVRNLLLRYNSRGLIRPCVAIDGILVSHAGLTVDWAWATAEEAEKDLGALWHVDSTAAPFSRIGRCRGGWDRYGGLFWSDWAEPKLMAFSQLVGHTHERTVRKAESDGRWACCIDVGYAHRDYTRMVGAWIRDGELELLLPVESEKAA